MTSVATTTTTTISTTTVNDGRLDMTQLPSLLGSKNSNSNNSRGGMTIQEELMNRRKTCRFIEEAGKIIKLPRVAIATAIVFFHRFYSKHSFYNHDRFEVAIACIVLAAKTEESPKKLNIVLQECYKLKLYAMKAAARSNTTTASSTTAVVAGSTSTSSTPSSTSLSNNAIVLLSSDLNDVKSEEFNKLKERILLLERVTLHTIGFELSIDHPHKFLFDIIRTITIIKPIVEFENNNTIENDTDANVNLSSSEIIKKLNNKLIQISINFANDSLHTTVCLQYNATDIAIACIYLGCNFAKIQPISTKTWCDVLFESNNTTTNTNTSSTTPNSTKNNTKYINEIDTLASISFQILELISEKKGTDKSIVTKIRKYLNILLGNTNTNDRSTNDTVNVKQEETVVDSKQQSTSTSTSISSATKRSQAEINNNKTLPTATVPSSSPTTTGTTCTTSSIEKSGSPETKKQRM